MWIFYVFQLTKEGQGLHSRRGRHISSVVTSPTRYVTLDAIKSTSEDEYENEFAPKAYDSDQNTFAVQVN